ncbi:MAG TPA: lipoate--protein ligase family protein [Verrucomicrobiae bacterium]|jgi:lipoate-protein ligase A|nr:lipoate--protein ligase family protein [Verrucomicrobiae bacterium]
MKYIDLSFATPAENLAADEALLEACETGRGGDTLRFWESPQYFVVIGYANHAAREANLEVCRAHGVPILRRCSGGGTVLQGPGCLNYSLILEIKEDGPTHGITATNNFVMQRNQAAIQSLAGKPVRIEGHTDLAIGGLKFSGNAQRRKKHFLIFHGTFLLNFDLALIEKFLKMPSKEPGYRQARKHSEFLMNLNLRTETVREAMREVWGADEKLDTLPMNGVSELAKKYATDEWNLKF